MDETIRKISYLQCQPKHRVDHESLKKVIELTKESGLQSSQRSPKIVSHGEQLNRLLAQNATLISVSRSIMANVFDCFIDKTKLMFLCDREGYILDIVSSSEILHWCFNKGIMLGSCFDYYSFGTNSISMSIYENSPAVVIGDEHYCDVLKSWSCIAAPIKIGGSSIGYVNISAEMNSDLIQLTALVKLMAELVESRIKLKNINEMKGYLEKGLTPKNTMDKARFFGELIVLDDLDLTVKEVEILYLMYHGRGFDHIASIINISKNTLKTHLKHIYHKLGVNSSIACLFKINEILKNQLARG